jgi:hypothetical protein
MAKLHIHVHSDCSPDERPILEATLKFANAVEEFYRWNFCPQEDRQPAWNRILSAYMELAQPVMDLYTSTFDCGGYDETQPLFETQEELVAFEERQEAAALEEAAAWKEFFSD